MKFYHAAKKRDLISIYEKGLLPSKKHLDVRMRYPAVFLSEDPFWATMFGEVVLEITIPENDLLFKPRGELFNPWEYLYRGSIPPHFIKYYADSETILRAEERKGKKSRVKFV